MCGITGAIDPSGDVGPEWVNAMNRAQAHRGPDDAVMVQRGPFVLGNTRLAILDPTAAGNQPFQDPDGRYVAVLNGEIYNYLELIDEHRLQVPNGCDGAVIPLLWARFGAGTLEMLRGMYALAVIDSEAQQLVLARDPFGIKPLYWRAMPGGRMAFASEPRALAHVGSTPPVRRDAIARFLHLGALGADDSPFDGVHAVPANASATFALDGPPSLTGQSTRHLGTSSRSASPATAERMAVCFEESVRIHLRSDVPSALLLSSGVDSTAIAAVAGRLGHRLHCLTVEGPGMSDEAGVAAATARHYGHPHEVVHVDVDAGDVSQFFGAMQRPTIDGLNTFVVCKAVRSAGYKVALSGVGGDEALGGYSHTRALPWLRVLRSADRLPAPVGRALAQAVAAATPAKGGKVERLIGPGGPRDAMGLSRLQRELFSPDTVERLCGIRPAIASIPGAVNGTPDGGRRSDLARAEIETYMMSMLLPDSDAFSMTWSVELRVPFVDREFFESALRSSDGIRNFGKETLLRALGDDHLMEAARRPKVGFGLPMRPWIETGLLSKVRRRATEPGAPVWEYVDRQEGLDILGRCDRWSEPWALSVINEWLRGL